VRISGGSLLSLPMLRSGKVDDRVVGAMLLKP